MVYSLFNPLIVSILFFGKKHIIRWTMWIGPSILYYKNKCVSSPNGCAECSSNNINLLPCKKCFCPAILENGKYCVRHNNDYNPSQCHLITCPDQDYFINDRYECQTCGYGG